jgi:hypothetical protein
MEGWGCLYVCLLFCGACAQQAAAKTHLSPHSQELLSSGLLVEVPGFSKFLHGACIAAEGTSLSHLDAAAQLTRNPKPNQPHTDK